MSDLTCNPPCGPNDPNSLPVRPTGGTTPFNVTIEECDGPQVRQATQTVEVLWPEGMVVRTRPCDPGTDDFDSFIRCDPNTGDSIIVVVSYSTAGVPTATAYNLDGSPYGGLLSDLVQCPDADLESDPLPWCDNGQNVTQWIVKSNGQPNGTVYWTDANGIVIPPPSGPNLVRGVCPVVRTNQWRASGVLPANNVFNLALAAGTTDVVSFTVSFINDFGSIDGVVTPPGSWTWSAEQGQEITNLPTNITSTGSFYVHWTERS
jgi:hypothetical protein